MNLAAAPTFNCGWDILFDGSRAPLSILHANSLPNGSGSAPRTARTLTPRLQGKQDFRRATNFSAVFRKDRDWRVDRLFLTPEPVAR